MHILTYICMYMCTNVQTNMHTSSVHNTKIINLKELIFYTATKSKETKNTEDSDTKIYNL